MVLPRRDRSPGLRVQLAIIALVVLGLGIWQFQRQPPHVESPTAPTGPATTAPAPPPAAETGSASRAAEKESGRSRRRRSEGRPHDRASCRADRSAAARPARSRTQHQRGVDLHGPRARGANCGADARAPQQPRRSLAEAQRRQAESRARLPWTGEGDHRPQHQARPHRRRAVHRRRRRAALGRQWRLRADKLSRGGPMTRRVRRAVPIRGTSPRSPASRAVTFTRT